MQTKSPARYALLMMLLFLVLGVGFTIGLTIRPGAWYESLTKPWFTPPNWLFGPAWTVVYILIAIAGWRVMEIGDAETTAFRLWVMQMLLNWTWTPVFFGSHQIGIGLVVLLSLLAVVLSFIMVAKDFLARWCFVPYALWLVYATSLNAAIAVLT